MSLLSFGLYSQETSSWTPVTAVLFIEKSRESTGSPRDRMEQNKQCKYASCSAYSLVAPLGHLVVDGHLKEAVRLHVGSYFLQGLKGKHTKPYKDSNPAKSPIPKQQHSHAA